MFFDSWQDLLRVAAVGIPAYLLLILVLRTSGKRTLTKLNAFDLVVTVALGSTLATVLLSSEVSLVEGLSALTLLVLLQLTVTWASVRSSTVRGAVRSGPSLLLESGRMLPGELRRHRMTEAEVRQAVRQSGLGSLGDVGAVVLEADGTLSVIAEEAVGDGTALRDLG